jgi:hypothetical protein
MGRQGNAMADKLSDLPSSMPTEGLGSLVVGIKGFLVWLGGSLASITAIFYATGYLITRAHLSMLGLHGVLDFDNHAIVQEGGKFFLVLGYSTMSNAALPLLAVLGPAVIGMMVLRRLLGNRAQRWRERFRNRLPGFGTQGWMRLLAFVCLFFAFLWHAETFLLKFQNPLCIGNLLYAEAGSTPCPASMMGQGADVLRTALLGRDDRLLNNAFEELVFGFVLAILLAYLTWRTTLPWRWRGWYAAPSLVAAALYLILLPMDYGVLQRPITYPRITLTPGENVSFPMRGPLFLLNQTTQEFVVWDASIRKLFWIPAATVKRAELDGTYDLFASARYPAVMHGENK